VARPFVERHIGINDDAERVMLEEVGFASREDLMRAAVPRSIAVEGFRSAADTLLPEPITEAEALAQLRELASANRVRRSFIGQGYYGAFTPTVIARNVLENPSWYTAYTPYQPEMAQGRLEALINFQTWSPT